jgi:hypothetical protein
MDLQSTSADAGRIAHKAAEFRELGKVGDGRQPVRFDEVGHALELDEEDRIRDEKNAAARSRMIVAKTLSNSAGARTSNG